MFVNLRYEVLNASPNLYGTWNIYIYIYIYIYLQKTKLHDLSPRANYTDRATERPPLFCEVSVNVFADRGCHVVSVTNPYGCNLGFLDRNMYIYTHIYKMEPDPIAAAYFIHLSHQSVCL
jgi:hypothetical protein